MTSETVLSWWFDGWDDTLPLPDDDATTARWWRASPEGDASLRATFGDLHEACVSGAHREWTQTSRGLLARVIVLDQFSRVLYRGTPRAFYWDGDAVALAGEALQQAWDRDLAPIERSFLYMPLMHAEDRATQRRSLSVFTGLAEEVEEAGLARADYYRRVVGFAQRHKDIIDRFGRYPHRNIPLERTATPEELAYLDETGDPF